MRKSKPKSGRGEDYVSQQSVKGLVTSLEEQLQETEQVKGSSKKSRKMNEAFAERQQEEEQEDMSNIPMSQIRQIDAERLSVLVNQLMAKNKINAKNAFEVPLVHLQETNDYNSMNGDNSWKRLSSALENNNKIYGYRVDATHSFTYKVLELVTRSERNENNEDEQQFRTHRYENNTLNTQFFSECIEDYYIRHLERNLKNINIAHLDTFFNVNPILEKTKRTFDQQGLRALLLNNIEIDDGLALCINYGNSGKQIEKRRINDIVRQAQQVQQSVEGLGNYNIFSKIHSICCLNGLSDEPELEVKRQESQFETMWREFEQMSLPQQISKERQSRRQKAIESQQKEVQIEEIQIQQEQVPNSEDEKKSDAVDDPPIQILQYPKVEQSGTKQYLEIQQEEADENNNGCRENDAQASSPKTHLPANEDQIHNHLGLQTTEIVHEKKVDSEFPELKQTIVASHEPTTDPAIDRLDDPIDGNLAQEDNAFILPKQIKEVPISSFIKLNYLQNERPSHLRQIAIEDEFNPEKQTALQTWNSSQKKPRFQRKPKPERDPMLDYINFRQPLDMRKKNNRRSCILAVDKVKKLQLKKFLKSAQNLSRQDRNAIFNTSRWPRNYFQLLSGFREVLDESIRQESEAIESAHQQSYPGAIDLQLLNETQVSTVNKSASLRSVKEKIRNLVFERRIDSFAQIYMQFVELEGYISPALCFLTVLHLSNEYGFQLVQEESTGFTVIWSA